MADTSRLSGPHLDYWQWQLDAACRGMDSATFFHPPSERNVARERRIQQAKAVCRTCPAIQDCLAHALRAREPYGVWGGHSEDERAALLGLQSLRYPARSKDTVSSEVVEGVTELPVDGYIEVRLHFTRNVPPTGE